MGINSNADCDGDTGTEHFDFKSADITGSVRPPQWDLATFGDGSSDKAISSCKCTTKP